MAFSPVSLYQLERSKANNFVSAFLNSFDWFLFFFYGMESDKTQLQLRQLQNLSERAGKKVAFVDFLPINDELNSYLYGSWRKHCPRGTDNETINLLQQCYGKIISDQDRAALEKLLYFNLFINDSFQPSIALVNFKKDFMLRRKFVEDQKSNLEDSINDFLNYLENNKDIEKSILADIFNPPRCEPPRNASKQDIESAFVNFLDEAEDCLDSFSAEGKPLDLDSVRIQSTEKFKKAFDKLQKEIQTRAINLIKKLVNNAAQYKKIKLSTNIVLNRMRINDKFRIHFQGTYKNPILINIGAHKLSDYGYIVD